MSRGVLTTVLGSERFIRTSNEAADALGELKLPHAKAGRMVGLRARQEAPVLTGALRQSVKWGGNGSYGYIQAGGTGITYAFAVHSGHGSVKPNPFLTRAARQTESQWVSEYENAIDKAISKVKGI